MLKVILKKEAARAYKTNPLIKESRKCKRRGRESKSHEISDWKKN